MGTRTSHVPGTFCWIDLATDDQDAAKSFYAGLFGWEYDDMPTDAGVYSMAKVGGHVVAAIAGSPAGDPSPPHWNNYVSVEDVGACARAAGEHGGSVLADAFDVLEAGRMAVLRDPAGAVFSLWEPRKQIGAELVNAIGALTWNELGTPDVEAAASFYAEVFGWGAEPMETDDGPAYIVIQVDGRSNGGIREQSAEEQAEVPPNWMPYIAVDSTDASAQRAGELGGTVMIGPMDIANGGRIATVKDPQGAFFSLWEGPLED